MVDLARVSAKIEVPHSILCNIAFEHGLEMSVDEVRAAALTVVASDPVSEEMSVQAAAAPSTGTGTGTGTATATATTTTCPSCLNDSVLVQTAQKTLEVLQVAFRGQGCGVPVVVQRQLAGPAGSFSALERSHL